MDSISLSYVDFKSLINSWNIKPAIRYVVGDNGVYHVWVHIDNRSVTVTGGLTAAADISDFNANYAPNRPGVWLSGKNANRSDRAFSFAVAASVATTFDYQVPVSMFIWTSELYVRGLVSLDGDNVQVEVVDKAGIYYPAGTVLSTPIVLKYLTGTRIVTADNPSGESMFLPSGLFIRVIYTEVQGVAKTMDVNLVCFA